MDIMMRKRKLDMYSNKDIENMNPKELMDVCNDLHMTTEAHKLKGVLDGKNSLTDKVIDGITDTFDNIKSKVVDSISLSINNYANELKNKYAKYFHDMEEIIPLSKDAIKKFEENIDKEITITPSMFEVIKESYKNDNTNIKSKFLRNCATLSEEFDKKSGNDSFLFYKTNRKIYDAYQHKFFNLGNGEVLLCLSKEDFELGTPVDSSVFIAVDLAPTLKGEKVKFKDLGIDKKTLLKYLDVDGIKKELDVEISNLRGITKKLEVMIDHSIKDKESTESKVEAYKSHYDYLHEQMYMLMKYHYRASKAAIHIVDKFVTFKEDKNGN